MPIRYEWDVTSGLHCPRVICESCGGRIEDVRMGMVLWKPNEKLRSMPYFLHKQLCDVAFCRGRGGRSEFLWDELERFLENLTQNVQVRAKRE